ncbi:hypothetical protein F5144DRAFT_89078 [Chaetomium tenue]|uniref:Uncharacterized protein n=1 Tax=Chaetomium tenue TaxID=1854479 RepID=A0ACB7PGX8_9PEZI|nr:hypothetical protein F5144DRAFT_89078 [Chaetomium globosum]
MLSSHFTATARPPSSKAMPERISFTINDTVKCQACLSCGTRKIRCTKESSGCMRCISEALDCVYPPRRAMGRPKSHVASEASHPHEPLELQFGPCLHIMRLGSPPSGMVPKASKPNGIQAPTNCRDDQQASWTEFGIGVVNCLKSINFGDQDSLPQSLLAGSLPTTPNADPGGKQVARRPESPCCCTERLIGCLDALSTMPNDLRNALWTVRCSSRTMYEVLKCLQCRAPSEQASELLQDDRSIGLASRIASPIIVTLLTAMCPLISGSYCKAAELVEKEAKTAMDGGSQLIFDLETYGGLWGPLGESSIRCQEYYSNLTMDAGSWRTTVRALLRADIHGFDIQKRNDEDGTDLCHQPGLYDLISDIKDMLNCSNVDHGQQNSHKCSPTKPQSHTGLTSQMMEAAEQSLSQLGLT